MDKLCGTSFVYNGNKFDYCFRETIRCLLEFCDYVVIAAGGTDGTLEDILQMKELGIDKFSIHSPNTNIWSSDKCSVIKIADEEWVGQHGKEKLNYFSNIAIQYADKLGFQYNFYLQCDEIAHEKSYNAIREAIQTNEESYMCTRVNLWKSPYMQLNVPQNRKPCSTQVLRLGKISCRSYGDAESLMAHTCTFDFTDRIRIYHMGFVRKQEVMRSKIINMQVDVFGMENYDKKLDESELFNPDLWFDPKTDLKPIDEPLPKLIQDWASKRVYKN